MTLTTPNISLLKLKERVQSLPDPVRREIAETVLCNLDEYDHIYTEIFNVIEQELAEIQ